MFEYFPDNYNWSLAFALSLGMGAELSELDDACRPLLPLAGAEDADALQRWFDSWSGIAGRASAMADADRAAGHDLSAARKYRRAANYRLIAERQLTNESPLKRECYDRALADFRSAVDLGGEPVEFVEIPFEPASLPALFVPARDVDGPAPCLVLLNGFDVTKEYLYLLGANRIADRGVGVLLVDQPGSGGALRLHGMPLRPDVEVPASACLDYLGARPDTDADRVGIGGISLGGYFAPRAAAMDHRFRACVAWGACHHVPKVAAALETTDARSVPDFQMAWVLGTDDLAEQAAVLSQLVLDGVAEKIPCPLLILHGAEDQQVPLEQARMTAEQATGAESVELKVFEAGDWGDQHCQVDNPSLAVDYIGDWVRRVL